MLRIGYFDQFKGSPSVLLSGNAADVAILLSTIAGARNDMRHVPLHEIAARRKGDSVSLWAVPDDSAGRSGAYYWRIGGIDEAEIDAKLESLLTCGRCHQYFELVGGNTVLVVSVDEYDSEKWWADA